MAPLIEPDVAVIAARSCGHSCDQTRAAYRGLLLSLYVPVATICCVLPTVTEGVSGVTVIVVRVGSTMKAPHPDMVTTNHTSQMPPGPIR